jgi:PIN domain nuclease of toxin-antitoxin system
VGRGAVIILDTHAWIWLLSDPGQLGSEAQRVLRKSRSKGIAAISCWEVAMLVARGRIELDRDPVAWMDDALRSAGIDLLPLTPAVAVASAQLGMPHGDPADRLIVATALTHGAVLVTKDERIRQAGIVHSVW